MLQRLHYPQYVKLGDPFACEDSDCELPHRFAAYYKDYEELILICERVLMADEKAYDELHLKLAEYFAVTGNQSQFN